MLTAIEAVVISEDTHGEIEAILGRISSAAADGYRWIEIEGSLCEYIRDALESLGYDVNDTPPFGENDGWEISW